MTASSLLNDLLRKPARALTVLGALKNHEEGRRKVKSMPNWFNLSQGGSMLHSPEATEKEASTTSAGVRGKDPQPVVSGRRARNLAEILSSYKKRKKPKKRPRAKPAAKEPPKKKAKLLPREEMRRRSRLPEMMTMRLKLRRHRFQTEDHTLEHGFPSNERTSGERGEECRLRSGAPGERRYPETSCSRRPNWAVPVQSIGSLLKKVPTRTGPCCTPSTCHSHGPAPHQGLHFHKNRKTLLHTDP